MRIFDKELNNNITQDEFMLLICDIAMGLDRGIYKQAAWNRFEHTLKRHGRHDLLPILEGAKPSLMVQPKKAIEKRFKRKLSQATLNTLLEKAIKKNKFKQVKNLVKQGADLGSQYTQDRVTPLHLAVKEGNPRIIKFLLDNGANTRSRAPALQILSPFTYALEQGAVETYIDARGFIEEHEMLDLMCSYHVSSKNKAQIDCLYSYLLNNNKIKMRNMEERNNTLVVRKTVHAVKNLCLQPNKDYIFTQIPNTEIWRLFVEGDKQHVNDLRDNGDHGWCGYETREPGYLNAAYHAMEMAVSCELDVQTVMLLQQQIMHHMPQEEVERLNNSLESGLIPNKTLSLRGYRELNTCPYSEWNTMESGGQYGVVCVAKQHNNMQALELLIQNYQIMQNKNNNEDREQTLKNIIFLASGYARLYPVNSHNRMAMILMNSELVKYQFAPVILDNPNKLKGFSQEELLDEVYEGMYTTHLVMQMGRYPRGKTTAEYQKQVSLPLASKPNAIAFAFEAFKQECKFIERREEEDALVFESIAEDEADSLLDTPIGSSAAASKKDMPWSSPAAGLTPAATPVQGRRNEPEENDLAASSSGPLRLSFD